MEAASNYEMSADLCQTTRLNNPEYSHLDNCCSENLKHQLQLVETAGNKERNFDLYVFTTLTCHIHDI